jgi:FAD-dependent oxidoreductase domain-containing protein 1
VIAERAEVLVAGGGVVGSAIACALAERGVRDVHVLDLDLAGRYASSELNAGGARATWWQEVNAAGCRDTLAFFAAHAAELDFRPCGYLWLYADRALYGRARERHGLQQRLGLGVELLEPAEVWRRWSLLDRHREEIVGATFSPRDGLVNPNAVRRLYRSRAEALGVRFHNHHYVAGVETSGRSPGLRRVAALHVLEIRPPPASDEGRRVERMLTSHHVPPEWIEAHHVLRPEVVVNALGAWSPVLSAKLGVRDVATPVRRQIGLVDVHEEDLAEGVELGSLGMIVDPSGLYFHPEGRFVLAGYSTPREPPGYDFHYDGRAFFEEELWPRLAWRMSSFERCEHVRGWAGLYAVTPDCSGVVGRVTGFANLIEAHSFTGRGVMQSYAVGRGVAELITRGGYQSLDLSPLAADRFRDPARLVPEDLHI